MKNLVIEIQPDAPYYPGVNFNAETGECIIEGESYMEEAYKFYMPLLEWVKEYTIGMQKSVQMNFRLTYFNTSSSRLILDLLDVLNKYIKSGGNASVNWYYDPEDPDMKDEIEDFEIESGVSINLEKFEV